MKFNQIKALISVIVVLAALLEINLLYVQMNRTTLYDQKVSDSIFHSLEDMKEDLITDTKSSIFPRFSLDDVDPDWHKKVLRYGWQSNSSRRFLSIGIVTAKRPDGVVYLHDTLRSLLTNADGVEYKKIRILILLSDLDINWRENISNAIQNDYPDLVNGGTIQILQSIDWMYPRLDNLTHHYAGHSKERVKWKSKQNIDFTILWLYVFKTHLSDYYLHLEDDVISTKGYIKLIQEFIEGQKNNWICLEFSELGMIAKLYHTYHLESLAKMVSLFYEEQPADFTFLHFNSQMLQFGRIIRKPTIFQHIGQKSSLFGKIQTIKDRFFLPELLKLNKSNNPPAIIKTNLKISNGFSLENAYTRGSSYIWCDSAAQKDDYFRIIFKRPHNVKRIVVSSGQDSFPKDIFHNAVLEISSKRNTTENCFDYKVLGEFTNGTIDTRISNITQTHCIQIRVLKTQQYWVIIREIGVFL